MPKIQSVSSFLPPYTYSQEQASDLLKNLFTDKYEDLERLLKVFENGEIESRQFCVPMEWFEKPHDLEERNRLYIELATSYGVLAINACLHNQEFLTDSVHPSEIDGIIFISSTGFSTPSIDARILNQLPFSNYVKRIPIWGLGCAGGASGLSRAFDYCLAYPKAKVLVLCVELCSLTFQPNDYTKSNLIGASLFADGIACALVCGDEVKIPSNKPKPTFVATSSKMMPNSENVMGWDMKNDGLHVVFSKSIPSIIEKWLKPFVTEFLAERQMTTGQIDYFIAHPGGKKVLTAYEKSLGFDSSKTAISRDILRNHGNMSSPTVFYVLEAFMKLDSSPGDIGLLTALGPGFSGELVLLEWQ
ncbi:MAG: type III polyketide synthase [Paenisporosarcina sp.]